MSVVLPNLVLFVVMLLVVAAVIVGVVSLAGGSGHAAAPQAAPWLPPATPNRALEELDLRYARGEIDRDEYLQRRADLSDSPR